MEQDRFENEHEEGSIEYVTTRRSLKLGDIIMLQCILGLVIIIALVILNIFSPEKTNQILGIFKEQLDKPFEFSDEIEKFFSQVRGLL